MKSHEQTPVEPTVKEINTQHDRCYLLHTYDYSESSLVAEVFSKQFGRLTLLAKGAKRPHARNRSILLHFQALELQWSGKNTLKTLNKVTWIQAPIVIDDGAWMAAWYCNELVLNVTAPEDPHPELFDAYENALRLLASGHSSHEVLRWFEWKLLQNVGLGFDPMVTRERNSVDKESLYQVSPQSGVLSYIAGEPFNPQDGLVVSGEVLQDLYNCCFCETKTEKYIRQLLKIFIDHALQGRHLKTRQVFQALHKRG